MLRRLGKDEVRLGMYIHSLEGPWLDHPFWRTRFLLTDPEDLRAIHESGIVTVVVDDARGDIAAPSLAVPPPSAVLKRVIKEAVAEEAAPPAPKPVRAKPVPKSAPEPVPCSAGEELDRATETIDRSKKVIAQLLTEVRMGRAADVAKAMPVVEDITASVDRNPHALVSMSRMRSKDEYTFYHSLSVCALMINLARALGHDEEAAREAGLAGLLHDFGKVIVPDSVLNKAEALTEFEFAMVREHPERGYQAIKASGYSDIVADVALHHHERVDGRGYPHGLTGDKLSLHAKMAAVCDVYDAITSRRPYKAAGGPAASLAQMFQSKGHFDETILAAFVRSIGIYPVGSLVRLQSNRLALVIEQDESDTMRPVVRAFYCIATRARVPSLDINLAERREDAIVSREEPIKWGFTSWESQWTALIRSPVRQAAA